MRIGELASAAGVSVRAIRYYESIGLIESVREANGYRDFDETALTRVRNIRTLLDSGLDGESVAAVGHCLDEDLGGVEPCAAAIELYEQRLAVVEDRLEHIAEVRAQLAARLTKLRNGRS